MKSLDSILEELWDSRNGLNDKSNYIAQAKQKIDKMIKGGNCGHTTIKKLVIEQTPASFHSPKQRESIEETIESILKKLWTRCSNCGRVTQLKPFVVAQAKQEIRNRVTEGVDVVK